MDVVYEFSQRLKKCMDLPDHVAATISSVSKIDRKIPLIMFPVRSPKQESVFEISELELECI
jgi:hypothetical protein